MKLRYPACFSQFHCIAAACPDSCCQEWEVLVDPESARRYRQMPGPLGEDLRQHLRQEDGDWFLTIENRRCPMWRRDGLCRIQAEAGHEALCQTCRDFPRIRHDYGDFVEFGLELSCPEVARMLFSGADLGWIQEECPGGEGEYDPADMEILLNARETMLEILEDSRYSVPRRLALMLLYGYQAQGVLDGAEQTPFDPEEALAFGRTMAKPGDPAAITGFYQNLEILTDRWRNLLENPRPDAAWDEKLLILARYGVLRYALQAISDFDLTGRVKMVIFSCVLTHILGKNTEEIAQIYGKEIENNIDNVESVLDGVYSHSALTDDKLLGILLEELP